MKWVCESSADRITDLPADVIQRILVFLPIKDAAKTSILSTEWRHHWRSIPQLVFDDGFARIPEDTDAYVSNVMNKLIMLKIYNSLLVHDGPITKFVLSFPGLRPCAEIDNIIGYLTDKGVQEFKLLLSVGHYKVHSSLFSALHLKILKLEHCEFRPPSWFGGFSKLTHLQLLSVTLPNDFFENFLPKCPMVKRLVVVSCDGPAGKHEIRAPCLKFFMFMGSKDACFICSPALPLVSFFSHHTGASFVVALFASPSALHVFSASLQGKCLAPGDNNAPARLSAARLPLVQYLVMKDVVLDSWRIDRVFVALTMSFPNLRMLAIQQETGELHDQPANDKASIIRRLLEAEDPLGCLQHLREFKIRDSLCGPVELDLVRFVLVTAPKLRLIHIKPSHKLDSKKVTKFMKEVMKYRRVSTTAEVICKWKGKERMIDTFPASPVSLPS